MTRKEMTAAVILPRCGRDGAASWRGGAPGGRLRADDLARDPEERGQDGRRLVGPPGGGHHHSVTVMALPLTAVTSKKKGGKKGKGRR